MARHVAQLCSVWMLSSGWNHTGTQVLTSSRTSLHTLMRCLTFLSSVYHGTGVYICRAPPLIVCLRLGLCRVFFVAASSPLTSAGPGIRSVRCDCPLKEGRGERCPCHRGQILEHLECSARQFQPCSGHSVPCEGSEQKEWLGA